ncbi:type 1 glutamine amidotransferase [Desulfotomaculum copahuensis]|uniref:GMP synthase n=1 Tax=Desulfotomaculum copahuensis TaxID=1838280 RepID=A0A1B7LE15_9FIRM|nr:gamma-glutamyl-gamma-aminobutyrate hydrolase family protein [Desulfotomaculum copahuensis]OAT81295.1 GMP synthase [Desulfotomaculum copahuensis]
MRALVVQNVGLEGPGSLQPAMLDAGWELTVRVMDSPGTALPANMAGYRALIVLGGPMNVYEEDAYPYLRQVDELIRDAAGRRIPVLGVCLGAQLIARALGAPVTRNPVKEIGWYPLQLTAEGAASPLFAGLPAEFYVFQWHGDTFTLPAGAKLLATGRQCVNQAFSWDGRVFALQFHLEVTPQIIESWTEAYAGELAAFGGREAPAKLLAETAARAAEYGRVAGRFMRNWLHLLRR